MTVYPFSDIDELAANRDEALESYLRMSEQALVEAAQTFQPTPALNTHAVLALTQLGNYKRLRRAHATAVAG